MLCIVVLVILNKLFGIIFALPLNAPVPNLSSYAAWFEHEADDDDARSNLRYFEFGNKTYYISPFRANFFQSVTFCKYYKMELLSILSKEENEAIYKNLEEYGFVNSRFWTSGNKLPDNIKWVWMSSGYPVVYANWIHLEHNKRGGYGNCIEIKQLNGELRWIDVDCFNGLFLYFICESFKSKTNEMDRCNQNTEDSINYHDNTMMKQDEEGINSSERSTISTNIITTVSTAKELINNSMVDNNLAPTMKSSIEEKENDRQQELIVTKPRKELPVISFNGPPCVETDYGGRTSKLQNLRIYLNIDLN